MNEIVTALVGSTVLVAAASALVKKLIERPIELRFARLEEHMRQQANVSAHVAKLILESRFQVYMDLTKQVYYCRNLAKDILRDGRAESSLVQSLNTACYDFTTTLYAVRYVLEDPIYDQLHRFKLLLIGLVSSAKKRLSDEESGAFRKEIEPERTHADLESFEELNRLHNEVIECMREDLKASAEPIPLAGVFAKRLEKEANDSTGPR